jgi:ribosomal protein S27AE
VVRKTEKNCELCDRVFQAELRAVRQGWGRFCGALCARRNNQVLATKAITTKEGWRARKNEKRKTVFRHKDNARDAVGRALRSGKLEKMPCTRCGSLTVEAHHHDYSKPLEVVWMCRRCHCLEHKKRE